ncbi:MAG TPA: acylphosphatase [Xanthobacteraceae bacterium]|nr:acylphosphatase [Xanthobacteraceae bacterium]
MRKLVHLLINGNVQGVGYRAFVASQAEALELEGWVRNRQDGSVEAVLGGDAEDIEEMIDSCRKGPAACSVSDIVQSDTNEDMLALRGDGRKFSLLPTL